MVTASAQYAGTNCSCRVLPARLVFYWPIAPIKDNWCIVRWCVPLSSRLKRARRGIAAIDERQ
jgi:hypothetical protein